MDKRDYKDFLTGLYNRMGLFSQYESLDPELITCVMFLDVDNFKMVNDTYGHKRGDDTLVFFARLLQSVMPEDAILARLGGDEFAAIIKGDMSKADCEQIAQNTLNAIKRSKRDDPALNMISSSIGIHHRYKVKNGLDHALNCADKAMYFAKDQGKNTYVIYSDYEETIEAERRIEKDFFRAIEENRIFVNYHPIHHLQSSKIVGTEACCLWKTPDGKVLGRNDFRHILQKSELVHEMDLFTLEQVCRDYAAFESIIRGKHRISVQFSHLFFMDESRMEELMKLLKRYNRQPSDFELDMDESMFSTRIMPAKIIECMKRLEDMGFEIALSHFGADFSSVKYLKDLPIARLKLDGEFIRNNLQDADGKRILKSVIKLGSGFKYLVVACGAGDENILVSLSECGCNASSGDYFSKKKNADAYADYLMQCMREDRNAVIYPFRENLLANAKFSEAKIIGEDIVLVDGISPNWGAVSFPGGPSQTNYLRFPASLFDGNGYTFSMWIKPMELQNWVSALYVRFQGGFISFMPNIAGGRSMFRIIDDTEPGVWHDLMTGAIPIGKWTFVTCSYDSLSGIARIYINGELQSELIGVPNLTNAQEVWLGGDVFQTSFCGLISCFQVGFGAMENEEIAQNFQKYIQEEGFSNQESGNVYALSDIEVHDPAIFEDAKSKRFFIYGTGAVGYQSMDLLHWKPLGQLVSGPPEDAREWTGSNQIWAPDIVKEGDEYRLYCSNSSWGVRQSCIFMAVSDRASGPFVPKQIVLKTENAGSINAIDANIINDPHTGKQYMVYGSFWAGIHIVELDRASGLPKEGEGLGKQLAVRPGWNDGAIEGPYIIYHPETDYFYLFVSYGSLTYDYNIRVGRSRCVTGPYLDYNGRDMVDPDDSDCSTGLMIACGYRYVNGEPKMGPGHNSVLLRENGEMYLVNHIRKMAVHTDIGPGLLQIRKMVLTPDGWPIAMGEAYNAEALLTVRRQLLIGDYERIELRPSIPQGIQHAHPMRLLENGRLEMASVIGTWELTGPHTMCLKYGNIQEFVHFEKGLDRDKNKTTVVMGGLTSQGICTWAKKEELEYHA